MPKVFIGPFAEILKTIRYIRLNAQLFFVGALYLFSVNYILRFNLTNNIEKFRDFNNYTNQIKTGLYNTLTATALHKFTD